MNNEITEQNLQSCTSFQNKRIKISTEGSNISIEKKRLFNNNICKTFDITELGFFEIFHGLFNDVVTLGNDNDRISFRMNKKDSLSLREYVESHNPLFKKQDTLFQKLSFRKRIWTNPQYIVYIKKKFLRADCETTIVHNEDIAFFNKSGVIFKKLYFGYLDQIDIKDPGKGFGDKLRSYIVSHGSKIGKETLIRFTNKFRFAKFYNPSYWFTKETLSFTDDAIVYYKKTAFNNDTIYLPYEKCSLVMPTKGWFRQRLCVFGEMHIMTKHVFDKDDIQYFINEVKKRGINTIATGERYRPSLLWFRWVIKLLCLGMIKDAKMIIGKEKLYVTPGRLGGLFRGIEYSESNDSKNDKDDLKRYKNYLEDHFNMILKDSITEVKYERKHFWNLFGYVLIDFREESIRKDQKDIKAFGFIILKHVFICKGRKIEKTLGE